MDSLKKLVNKKKKRDLQLEDSDLHLAENVVSSLSSMEQLSSANASEVDTIASCCCAHMRQAYDAGAHFAHKNILLFARSNKSKPLSDLTATFFDMINTLANLLLEVTMDDPAKIRSFVSFWLDKIEVEILDQSDYDVPKYNLRNTLCKILLLLKQNEDSLKITHLNIKEIVSDVGLLLNAKVEVFFSQFE